MRGGDIFMGAFGADSVIYNHFGYRTPIKNLYITGSACHPGGAISGGAGYISAGLIARDLGVKPGGSHGMPVRRWKSCLTLERRRGMSADSQSRRCIQASEGSRRHHNRRRARHRPGLRQSPSPWPARVPSLPRSMRRRRPRFPRRS